MFTGIVTDIGEVMETERRGDLRARIGTGYDVARVDIGASIACDGVCLTVIALGTSPRNWFDVEISAETLSKTNLDGWGAGKRVNLERALKVGDELGGEGVEDVALDGGGGADAEVAGGVHEAGAEGVLPEAVDEDACGEGVGGAGDDHAIRGRFQRGQGRVARHDVGGGNLFGDRRWRRLHRGWGGGAR